MDAIDAATNEANERAQELEQLRARVAELEARLEVARTVYREQKRRIAELESQLAARTGRGRVIDLPPGFQAAKEMAMRTGKTVRVAT